MRISRIGALVAVATGAYALLVRPRLIHAGATRDEIDGPFPGEDLIPGGRRGGTTAITIDAPPSAVWPWLVQMGCDRAGFYSWDLLDNGGRPSADTLHPEWQSVEVGQHLASTPSGEHWFEVAAVEPERFLGLRASYTLLARPFDPHGPRPGTYVDSLWGFQLRELPRRRTRLVVSGYAAEKPRLVWALLDFLFWEPAHFVMQKRQFRNLARRAERTHRRERRRLARERREQALLEA